MDFKGQKWKQGDELGAGYYPVLVRNHSGSDQVGAESAVTQIIGEKWMHSEKNGERVDKNIW